MASLKVYYNSACPVCKAGIEKQQCRMALSSPTAVEWLDVHAHPEHVLDIGTDLEGVRERLHVIDGAGTVHVGMSAAVALFAATPGQRWLGQVLKWPMVRGLSTLTYNSFARLLYRWNLARRHWEPAPSSRAQPDVSHGSDTRS